jgi:hypothetical protein
MAATIIGCPSGRRVYELQLLPLGYPIDPFG